MRSNHECFPQGSQPQLVVAWPQHGAGAGAEQHGAGVEQQDGAASQPQPPLLCDHMPMKRSFQLGLSQQSLPQVDEAAPQPLPHVEHDGAASG
jgi:hypothetical protein